MKIDSPAEAAQLTGRGGKRTRARVELTRLRGHFIPLGEEKGVHGGEDETEEWIVAGFEAHRAEVAERLVPAAAVEPALDELEDRRADLIAGVEGPPVEQLDLQRGEEQLAHGVEHEFGVPTKLKESALKKIEELAKKAGVEV